MYGYDTSEGEQSDHDYGQDDENMLHFLEAQRREKILKQSRAKKLPKRRALDSTENLLPDLLPDLIAAIDKGVPQEEEEDEDAVVADTYSDYRPLKLNIGKKHPDPVVETASLSSIAPVDITYKLSIPEETIESGWLSALQLESITYACQQHETFLPNGHRSGFLIGDGAGVGKGRTVAGVILENYLKGRKKALWMSVSTDLQYDCDRDLKDIGAGFIPVHPLNKFKYNSISSQKVVEGVIFFTYSALISETSQKRTTFKTRLEQLIDWCGEDFDGAIIFDECHRAKNLVPPGNNKKGTKTGKAVRDLQEQLPKARIVYASATGASEPRNMAYMVRLGLWGEGTPFRDVDTFIDKVEKRGVGTMEIVAMDMKLRGLYIARQLSFQGVTFHIEEVPLSSDYIKMYDDSVALWVRAMKQFEEAAILLNKCGLIVAKGMRGQFWAAHQRFFKYLCIAAKVHRVVTLAKEAVEAGKCVVIGLQSTGEARTLDQLEKEGELCDFVSTAKGVFTNLVEKQFPAPDEETTIRLFGGSALPAVPKLTAAPKRALPPRASQSVTKKPKLDYADGNDSDGFDYDPNSSEFESEPDEPSVKSRGRKKTPKTNNKRKVTAIQEKVNKLLEPPQPGDPAIDEHVIGQLKEVSRMKIKLLADIERLGERLPPNTLDQLVDELGGPDKVAEMTGRKGRVVNDSIEGVHYETRYSESEALDGLNLAEKKRFMDGQKLIAIISEAASSGISLQSDKRVRNQRRRVHITLELPWSADRAIQQFGRTHRSNQANAPEYIFLISNLAGERRFASIVAKRLESLGALTHADRRATQTRDLSCYNIDTKYGKKALEVTIRSIVGEEKALAPAPTDYKGCFFPDLQTSMKGVGLLNGLGLPETDAKCISKFLNRILGVPVDLQNRLFKFFTDTLRAIIIHAKKTGRYDMGILDLGAAEEIVERTKCYDFVIKHATGSSATQLSVVQVERGLSWNEAKVKSSLLFGLHEGFYIGHEDGIMNQTVLLAINADLGNDGNDDDSAYSIYKPNLGLQSRPEPLSEVKRKYNKISKVEAEKYWTKHYEASAKSCTHRYRVGHCSTAKSGFCGVGLRTKTYTVLSGSVLTVWDKVENLVTDKTSKSAKMQVIRFRTADGDKIVGAVIPNDCAEELKFILENYDLIDAPK